MIHFKVLKIIGENFSMTRVVFKNYFLIFGLFVLSFLSVNNVGAQEQKQSSRLFEAKVSAVDAETLVAGKTTVKLWGIQKIEGMPAPFLVAARSALDNVIGSEKVRCELKSRKDSVLVSQCTNSAELDLGLYVLQQGYAVVDRSAVIGTVFEQAYVQAESEAQAQSLGVWSNDSSGASDKDDNGYMFVLGAILLLGILGAFAVLTMAIMRGFQKVTDAQHQSMDMMARERELRDKEREIFATMLDSEIKANKSKIEAYLVVYDEMLKDLNDTDKTPKYKKAGDIVQVQPSMDRSVFDRNTDKLDILGDQLSSEVIHFYARIKTNPDYVNLEPDMAVEEAVSIVEKAYQGAQRLNKISDRLIDLFAQGGHSSEEY